MSVAGGIKGSRISMRGGNRFSYSIEAGMYKLNSPEELDDSTKEEYVEKIANIAIQSNSNNEREENE